MGFSCDLPAEMYFDRAQMLLTFVFDDPTLPDDIYALCETCDHVGWRWRLPVASVCLACRRRRLAA